MANSSDAARSLLLDAFERRYRYERDFLGFSAQCRFATFGRRDVDATVALAGPGEVEAVVECDVSPAVHAWLLQELRALSRSLWSHDFELGEGKYGMTLDETPHPLGPLVLLHDDPHEASFRVRKRRITLATRRQQALVEIVRFDRWYVRPDGRWLPAQFTAEVWDGTAAGPLRTDRYWDRYWPVDGGLYPQVRRVESTDERGTTTANSLTLRAWQPATFVR